jgi:hypothetical protein
MSTRRLVAFAVAVSIAMIGARGAAEEGPPSGWRTRLRLDTILRWAPRYVVDVEQTVWGADQLYWRRVDALPLYLRVGLDSSWQQAEQGPMAADLHLAAWAGLDTTLGLDDMGLAAGDFAVAYGRFAYGPASVWVGRRFITWGPPGGLQLDGGGVEVGSRIGLAGEVVVGRPVTPVYDSLMGVRPSFEGATLAYGARIHYRHPGLASASLAYTEQWARGIATDRLLSAEVTAVPTRRLDLRGSIVFDPVDLAVEQASAQIFVLAISQLELDTGYTFTDPTRLLPTWSILNSFASGAFHEASLGATVSIGAAHFVRAEGAARYYVVPGRDDDEATWWGYRADLVYRWLPQHRRYQLRAGASRRAEDLAGLTVVHGAFGWAFATRFQLAFEGAISIDDNRERARDSYLGRLTFEVALRHDWHLGASVDAARTAFVDAEVRGMLHASWRPQWGGGGR